MIPSLFETGVAASTTHSSEITGPDVIHALDGCEGYGVATVVRNLAKWFPSTRFIALQPGPLTDQLQKERLVWQGDTGLRYAASDSTVLSLCGFVGALWRWWLLAGRIQHDLRLQGRIIHAHSVQMAVFLIIFRLRSRQQFDLLLHLHSIISTARFFGLSAAIQRAVLGRSCVGIVAVSEAAAKPWKAVACRVWILHNCIELGSTGPEMTIPCKQPKRLILAASLTPEKGQLTALNAMVRLGPRLSDFELLILGATPRQLKGRYDLELEAYIRAQNLSDSVTIWGKVEDVRPFLRSAWAALQLRSTPEPCAMSVLEAMREGVPLIATNTGGTPELVRHDHEAVLIPANDPQALTAAILRLADDQDLHARLSAGCLQRIRLFAADLYKVKLTEIYTLVTNQPTRAAASLSY